MSFPAVPRPARRASRAVALLLTSAIAGAAGACKAAHEWRGTPIEPPAAAPRLALTTAGGRAYDLATERGKVALVFFGYTRCPDVCPTTLAEWARTKRALGADSSAVRFVFVSVDPARDTPDAADAYARRFDPTFVGVSGTPGEIGVVTSAWGVTAFEESAGGDPHAGHGGASGSTPNGAGATATPATTGPSIAHTPRTFVVDREGRLRVLHPANARPEDLAADVRALL